MAKTFREWNVEQSWLLPPSVMDFVPPDHVAHLRNAARCGIEWTFTRREADRKLHRHYVS